ncbi:MAG: hypothetical protein LBJ90_06720 [Treponema sp.]|jgi:hypothetical protein|nr:hypothetical protein [Treponema sp.]
MTARRGTGLRGLSFAGAALLAVLFGLSCAGISSGSPGTATRAEEQADEAEEPQFPRRIAFVPGEMAFVPASFPGVLSVSGIGLVTREARDLGNALDDEERDLLAASFAEAYMEGVFRGLPLSGVLGGDHVHSWPRSSPLAWVQNWRGSGGRFNSWGVSSLILAVRGLARGRVFLVQGDILDAYGRSSGLMGANGAAGYGAPRGNEFIHQGGVAQRFDFGLIAVDAEGNFVFTPEDPPSVTRSVPESVGLFESGGSVERIRNAFQSAWKTEIDGGLSPAEPDTPLFYLDFNDAPWILPLDSVDFLTENQRELSEEPDSGPPERDSSLVIRGLFYQGFGEGGILFILAEASVELIRGDSETSQELPLYSVPLVSPFLEAFLSAPGVCLSGAESLSSHALPAAGQYDEFARTLLEGIAFYGLPLAGLQPAREGETLR